MLKQLNLRNITVDIYHRTKRAVVNYDNEPILVIKGWENPPDEDYITNFKKNGLYKVYLSPNVSLIILPSFNLCATSASENKLPAKYICFFIIYIY